jgi:hypothetical protein
MRGLLRGLLGILTRALRALRVMARPSALPTPRRRRS